MSSPDKMYKDMYQRLADDPETDWAAERKRLEQAVREGWQTSRKAYELKKFFAETGGRTDLSVLDFGCGSGQLALFLALLGVDRVRGANPGDMEPGERVMQRLLGESPDGAYLREIKDGRLPFPDESFDVIMSEMVMEHVQDVPAYYREAARVLRPGGVMLLDYMHRLVPFDSHARRWFIHWFPRPVRNFFYDRLTDQGAKYYEEILNLRGLGHHRREGMKYFSSFENVTGDRLRKFDYQGEYEGNSTLRRMADRLINAPVVGPACLGMFSHLACVDVRMVK